MNKIKCKSKHRFNTDDEANLAGLKRMKIYNEIQLYYYLCKQCNKWHLTKTVTKYRVV